MAKKRDDPFRLPRPAVVNFSGGRTSGRMLWGILEAFGGKLPKDVLVCFENTGKERDETLDFVHEVSQRWGVSINWLEFRRDVTQPIEVKGRNGQPSIGQKSFAVVDYETASRDGRPFTELLETLAAFRRVVKGEGPVLPNPIQRMCSGELKIRTSARYLLSVGLDLEDVTCATDYRADEPKRIAKMNARNARKREPLECGHEVAPLGAAGVTEADVMEFWSRQPFDLKLKQHEGNCDLCFLKKVGKRRQIMKERPESAAWWIEKEEWSGQTFRKDEVPYRKQLEMVQAGEVDCEVGTDLLSEDCHCTG